MLSLKDGDRVRVLTAVAHRGPSFQVARIVVITLSLAILLAVPLFGWVRIDLWRGRHLLLGESVGAVEAIKGFVVAMAILWGFTFLTNMVVGRFFCGFGCPVGFVSRLGENVSVEKKQRRRLLAHLSGAGFVAAFVAAILLWWVDPRVVAEGSATARTVTGLAFLLLWAGGFLHAFGFRFGFCRSACPIGLYYRYVTSKAPVGILFSETPDACIHCGSCERICPVDLDPKALGEAAAGTDGLDEEPSRYGDAECIRCGDCIEACRMVFAKKPGAVPPLRFGWSNRETGAEARRQDPVLR